MPIDFSKLNSNPIEKIIHPREIFMSLSSKNKKYSYPRDVQSEVWNKWFENKNNKDNIIKMNTGSGKTVVGLLILKSCLHEGKGPAVYVVPDSYLINQVKNEALDLGINITDSENDQNYLRGKSILIINIHKLINGKSVFGMRSHDNIPIKSILIDDVHACLNTTESQFTIEIPRDNVMYDSIFSLFKEDLEIQYENKYLDLIDDEPNTSLLVPFWIWQNKYHEVNKMLHEQRNNDFLKFTYPLISDCLKLCSCIISSKKIEISPKSIPIDKISNFSNAERRIFMSATLSDDSILVSHFNIDNEKIKHIITPEKADDLGERLILFPNIINPKFSDEDLKQKFKDISKEKNVVVIVPSNYKASQWEDYTDLILDKNSLEDGVKKLKSEHVGLVLLVNRYDGIDLPEKACEVLIIDDLPDTRSEYNKIEERALFSSDRVINEKIQKIEQGMGRGVRSNNDYCVIFLVGEKLTYAMNNGGLNKFSTATKAQIELSEEICAQIKTIDDMFDTINYCLNRNTDWITISKSRLVNLKYNNETNIDKYSIAYRKAFNAAQIGNYEVSTSIINDIVNSTSNEKLKGWLKQLLAEYTNLTDPVKSQEILKSAIQYNTQLLKPKDGIQFNKTFKKFSGQGKLFRDYISENQIDQNSFLFKIEELFEKLIFRPETAHPFEAALYEIAKLIGYDSKRPELETGKGPDVLWLIGESNYLIIECKNGVTNETICKHDCNQLNGSIEWFISNYDTNYCNYTPIMIHLSNSFSYECSPNENIRIMTKDNLNFFKDNVLNFCKSVIKDENFYNINKINALLKNYKLSSDDFIKTYTCNFKRNSK